MKDTFVITVPIKKGDRKMMEFVEGWTLLKSYYSNTQMIRNEIAKQIKLDAGHVAVYPMTDWVDFCNDQKINLEEVWVGYIYLVDDTFNGVLKSAQRAIENTLEHLNKTNKETNRPNSLMYGMVDQVNDCTCALMKLNNYLKSN